MKTLDHRLFIILILVLSAFTHIWNSSGFPEIFYDEGVYMHRSMNIINGNGPQDGIYYDHPFFGQIFLGSMLYSLGYPDSLNVRTDPNSVSLVYEIPRILMGIIAVFDSFLVYKIAKKRYGIKIGMFASTFFAIMPMTWIMRRILLDSILLPFLLLAILFAMHSKNNSKFVLASGVCMGLAIFTKIPTFTMIPLLVYLIYSTTKNKRLTGLWFIPVLLIPLIWPAQSIVTGNFTNHWIHDVVWQTQRNRIGLLEVTGAFLAMDPVLFSLGLAGILLYVSINDKFILLWFFPYLIFLGAIGFVQYFHWMMLIPVFCIGLAHFVIRLGDRAKKPNLNMVPFFGVIAFGIVCTTMVVSTNLTQTQFEATTYSANLAKDNPQAKVLANPVYSWVLHDVFKLENTSIDYSMAIFDKIPPKIILISDPHLRRDADRGIHLSKILNLTQVVKSYDDMKNRYNLMMYPYSNLNYNHDAGLIEIKISK